MFEPTFAGHQLAPGCASLVDAPIIISDSDYEGVLIAAETLSADFARVTGDAPNLIISEPGIRTKYGIIAGSLEKSSVIHSLVSSGKLDPSSIRGKWESYITTLVEMPWEGCEKAVVICGSDKRGTIFGIYSLSEQIGVSP